MKRTSSSATGVVADSDAHSDKKQRTRQERGPAATVMPVIAEKTTTETKTGAAASNETTGEAATAASDGTGYVSDSLQSDSDDDNSISDSGQWPPDDDEENLPHQDQQSYLCSRCRQIDFEEIFSRDSLAERGDPILSFSDEQKVLRDPECAFCQAIQFIYPSLDTLDQSLRQSIQLVAVTTYDRNISLTRMGPERRIALTFAHQHECLNQVHMWRRFRDFEGLLHYAYDLVGYLAEERTIEYDFEDFAAASIRPYVDIDLIKRELRYCRRRHSKCRNEKGRCDKEVLGMRLIDCKARTIIPAPKGGCTYAALSYVWGTSQNASESSPLSNHCHEELPAELPNTIADAMLVALRLKIRYLWCDRYCIRQHPRNKEEKDEKHGQIARMCDIYSEASVTIIAAAGDGPHYGLPGVSRKRQPPSVRIGTRTLFATLPNPKMLIDCSKWSTRGWTFQEGFLARRRLVFTDQQVYFQCGETGTFESSSGLSVALGLGAPVYPYFSMGDDGVPDIWRMIANYAELTLGNPQDILNGFLGILKHYEDLAYPRGNFHARNIAGLPIDTEQDDRQLWPSALFFALTWRCDIPGNRRDGFPSWSWIGWYCKGFKFRIRRTRYLSDSRTRSPIVRLQGPSNEILEQDELHKLIEARHDFSDARFLHITAPSLEACVVPLETKGLNPCDLEIRYGLIGFDNTRRRLAVRYTGSECSAFINLSDVLLCNASVPWKGFRCFGIVLNEDHPDIADDQLGRVEYATTLIVVENDGGFERIGTSYVSRLELLQIGSTVREFKLM